MKVVVTGATGFVGTPLVAALRARGDQVVALVRNVERARHQLGDGVELVQAELETPGAWTACLDGADAVVHLAGEPIAAKRWDARQKQLIRDSRVESTRVLVDAIGKARVRPKVLVSASGVDYYAFADRHHDFDDDEVTEDQPAAESFLGRLCRDWEREALAAEAHGVRVACMRTGMVLGKAGGALAKLRRPFELFAGGKIGSGHQWVSWIHLDDVVNAYATAISDERYRGPINLVTDSTRNAEFSRSLGHALGKPSWLAVPGFALKAAVGGEFAESILNGRRVVPGKLRSLGFPFQHPQLDDAMRAAT